MQHEATYGDLDVPILLSDEPESIPKLYNSHQQLSIDRQGQRENNHVKGSHRRKQIDAMASFWTGSILICAFDETCLASPSSPDSLIPSARRQEFLIKLIHLILPPEGSQIIYSYLCIFIYIVVLVNLNVYIIYINSKQSAHKP